MLCPYYTDSINGRRSKRRLGSVAVERFYLAALTAIGIRTTADFNRERRSQSWRKEKDYEGAWRQAVSLGRATSSGAARPFVRCMLTLGKLALRGCRTFQGIVWFVVGLSDTLVAGTHSACRRSQSKERDRTERFVFVGSRCMYLQCGANWRK